jgi:hypothetical protein
MVLLQNYEEKKARIVQKIKVEIFAMEKASHKTRIRKRLNVAEVKFKTVQMTELQLQKN